MSEARTTIVSDEDLEEMDDHTDWETLQEKTEEEIEQAVLEDPDAALLDEEWFEKAKLVVPASDKERITIRLDEDIVEHFKQGGPGYQSRINDVLRAYVTSKRMEGEGSK
ncbi:BrnA antitoxin family protein [Salinibacter ruber]|uniref:BrnA antitoxin family protein n=1 Tax=Salinibacter ruber TaxID=146919 RepID=UPI002073E6A6|nr:BrnA antitoxin family protein [Salinibacter ruber]